MGVREARERARNVWIFLASRFALLALRVRSCITLEPANPPVLQAILRDAFLRDAFSCDAF